MTTILYAQPYDISVEGFYFRSEEEYNKIAPTIKRGDGSLVEEFEIQFIDGERIDAQLAEALRLHQGNAARFLELVDEWHEDQKAKFIIAVGENGNSFDLDKDDVDELEIDVYYDMSMRDLAIHFIDEGLFGEIPKAIASYIDYSAIARDLSIDYCEFVIGGDNVVYRCG